VQDSAGINSFFRYQWQEQRCNLPKPERVKDRKQFIKELMLELFLIVFEVHTQKLATSPPTSSQGRVVSPTRMPSPPTRSPPNVPTAIVDADRNNRLYRFTLAYQSQIFVQLRRRQFSNTAAQLAQVKGMFQNCHGVKSEAMRNARKGVVCWNMVAGAWKDVNPDPKGAQQSDPNRSSCRECYFQRSKKDGIKQKRGYQPKTGARRTYARVKTCNFGCHTCGLAFCLPCMNIWHKRRQQDAIELN